MGKTELLDLDKLLDAPKVVLGGKTYTLKPVSAAVFRHYEAMAALPEAERAMGMYQIARLLLPSEITTEEVDALHPLQISAIIEMATDPVAAARKYMDSQVEARAPNGDGDESPAPSSPTTGSDTPATAVHTELVSRLNASSRSHSPSPSTATR